MLTNEYLKRVYEGLEKRNANEPEFLQAVREVLESIQPVVEKHPEYEKAGLIERMVEPERIITFRVPWVASAGNAYFTIIKLCGGFYNSKKQNLFKKTDKK